MQANRVALRQAKPTDETFWLSLDRQAGPVDFSALLGSGHGHVIELAGRPAGILWYSVLWHRLPFLNLLDLAEPFRGQGIGRQALLLWERRLVEAGYAMALVSTQDDETAQGFFRKQGYLDCGSLSLSGTPLDQPAELFLRKVFLI